MKRSLSDTFIRSIRPEREIEIYDERVPGLVLRTRKNGAHAFYFYSDRGRRKTKLGKWPQVDTERARQLAKTCKPASYASGVIPTLREYFDGAYRPNYELTHKSGGALYSLSKLLTEFGEVKLSR